MIYFCSHICLFVFLLSHVFVCSSHMCSLFSHVFFCSDMCFLHVFVWFCINCVGTQNRELGWKISPQINQWISNEVEYENINRCLSWGFIRCFTIHWKYTFFRNMTLEKGYHSVCFGLYVLLLQSNLLCKSSGKHETSIKHICTKRANTLVGKK